LEHRDPTTGSVLLSNELREEILVVIEVECPWQLGNMGARDVRDVYVKRTIRTSNLGHVW
jgi:hypothetical protein